MKKVQARWYHKGRLSPIRLIVIHDMEWMERPTTAEDCAQMFKTQGTQASAHVCVDNNTVVRCVDDADTAWAAPGANADGLQMELAGYGHQTRAQWLDPYSKAMLELAAQVCADWCTKYKIPVRKLSQAELKAGRRGFTCHADVSAVYKRSDHGDPGKNFPWEYLLQRVKEIQGGDPPVKGDAPVAPEWPGRYLKTGVVGDDVKAWQRQMRARGVQIPVDGVYGDASRDACLAFQRAQGLDADGVVGPLTWSASWEAAIG